MVLPVKMGRFLEYESIGGIEIPNHKSQGYRCQVSGKRNIEAET